MKNLILSDFTISSAAGHGNQENLNSLKNNQTGLSINDFLDVDIETWIGRVTHVEEQLLPKQLQKYSCRNNQLAYLALHQDSFELSILNAKKKYGKDRIGIFLGTSTSGILSTELAYQKLFLKKNEQTQQNISSFKNPQYLHFREQHNSYSIADFVKNIFKLEGPTQVISTACSSSAKVFATASRYIEMGLCDAAIIGGVDSLCLTTLYGFNSLELVSRDICKPADIKRNGLSIGEAAAFILLENPEKVDQINTAKPVYLLGYGESSDAYHMSTPHPEGTGAIKAMQEALSNANLNANEVDYINLHGTATPVNDKIEDIAIYSVFKNTTCSSTKGWTGHTLGAAGAVEAIFSTLCIQNDLIPKSLNTEELDTSFNSNIVLTSDQNISPKIVASNSFGFGGNNCCLIFGDDDSKAKTIQPAQTRSLFENRIIVTEQGKIERKSGVYTNK